MRPSLRFHPSGLNTEKKPSAKISVPDFGTVLLQCFAYPEVIGTVFSHLLPEPVGMIHLPGMTQFMDQHIMRERKQFIVDTAKEYKADGIIVFRLYSPVQEESNCNPVA